MKPQLWDFKGHTVRMTFVDGAPWWIAADVCRVLEIKDVSDALERLDADEKGKVSIPTLGGAQQMSIVNEPGLYRLILGSRKPQAKDLMRWVTHDVLPSIRETGAYLVTTDKPQNNFAVMRRMIDQIEAQEARLREHDHAILAVNARVDLFGADTDYRTIRAFAKEQGIKLPENAAKALGMKAASACRLRGIRIGDVPDERYGRVHSYPAALIEELIGTAV